MKVEEVMTRWVRTTTPETKLSEIAAVMCLNRIATFPVVDEEGAVIGVISEKDVLHHVFPKLDDIMRDGLIGMDFDAMEDDYKTVLSGISVKDVMTRSVISVSPDMPILKAASIMVRNLFRRIPVLDDSKLVGILSLGDIHKALFRKSVA